MVNEFSTNIEKFHYLKFALKEVVVQILRSLAMSDNNYLTVWKLLLEQYEDMNELVYHHVGALFRLASVATNSAFVLCQLIDFFNNI